MPQGQAEDCVGQDSALCRGPLLHQLPVMSRLQARTCRVATDLCCVSVSHLRHNQADLLLCLSIPWGCASANEQCLSRPTIMHLLAAIARARVESRLRTPEACWAWTAPQTRHRGPAASPVQASHGLPGAQMWASPFPPFAPATQEPPSPQQQLSPAFVIVMSCTLGLPFQKGSVHLPSNIPKSHQTSRL